MIRATPYYIYIYIIIIMQTLNWDNYKIDPWSLRLIVIQAKLSSWCIFFLDKKFFTKRITESNINYFFIK
jgi:hypothetical protein